MNEPASPIYSPRSTVTQQYVIHARSAANDNGLPPLGTREEIMRKLARFNTTHDGVDRNSLHGPGIRIDFLPVLDDEDAPLTQMLLTVNEEEIGWLVLHKLAREFKWTIVDPSSGRAWSP